MSTMRHTCRSQSVHLVCNISDLSPRRPHDCCLFQLSVSTFNTTETIIIAQDLNKIQSEDTDGLNKIPQQAKVQQLTTKLTVIRNVAITNRSPIKNSEKTVISTLHFQSYSTNLTSVYWYYSLSQVPRCLRLTRIQLHHNKITCRPFYRSTCVSQHSQFKLGLCRSSFIVHKPYMPYLWK